MSILELKGVTKQFGGLTAVDNLSMDVKAGEIVGLIGPNGAGKTTAFNVISGALNATRGGVFFEETDITRLKTHQIASRGLVRTFQANVLFQDLSVRDNVLAGCYLHSGQTILGGVLGTPRYRTRQRANLESCREIMEFMKLDVVEGQLAKNLPHGLQRSLGVAVALSSKPKMLMLDEPAAGLHPMELRQMMERIHALRERGITVLLVEHHMKAVMGLCDRIVVLNFGRKIAEGSPKEIQEDETVIRSYLGEDAANA